MMALPWNRDINTRLNVFTKDRVQQSLLGPEHNGRCGSLSAKRWGGRTVKRRLSSDRAFWSPTLRMLSLVPIKLTGQRVVYGQNLCLLTSVLASCVFACLVCFVLSTRHKMTLESSGKKDHQLRNLLDWFVCFIWYHTLFFYCFNLFISAHWCF